ncbi:ankyrin repeat domain-containing protein [bacterium]|jgi:ankyrin repeat protein|nr:ankyrin repeat domain-containing protein [bacterium]
MKTFEQFIIHNKTNSELFWNYLYYSYIDKAYNLLISDNSIDIFNNTKENKYPSDIDSVIELVCSKCGSDESKEDKKIELDLLKLLIKKGAEINDDCLYYATSNNRLDVIRLLHKKGANLNSKDKNNNTILHIAFENGYLDIVCYMLKNKVNIIKNNDGDYPFEYSENYELSYSDMSINDKYTIKTQKLLLENYPDLINILKKIIKFDPKLKIEYDYLFNMNDIGLF